MTEDYCDLETSKLLREKGFDEKTLSYYEDGILHHGDWFEWNRSPLGQISAPTLQMAMKWLRENHLIYIDIRTITPEAEDPWFIANIRQISKDKHSFREKHGIKGSSYKNVVDTAIYEAAKNYI